MTEHFKKAVMKEAFDPAIYLNMQERAVGFWYADNLFNQASKVVGAVRELMTEAKPLRAPLLEAATYLWSGAPMSP